MFFAWVPSGRTIAASFWLGVAYVLTVGWTTWPVTDAVLRVVWVIVSLALVALAVWRLVRAHRKNLATQFAQPTT